MHNPESSLIGGKAGSQLRKVLLLLLGCPGCKLRSSATEAQGTRRRLWRGQERASTGPSAQQAAAGSGEVGQVLGHELATRALGQAAHEHDGDGRRQGQHHGHRKRAVPAWQRTNPPWACLHAVEQEISPSMQSTITPPRRASAVWPIFQNSKGAILTCDSKACALKRTAAGLQTLCEWRLLRNIYSNKSAYNTRGIPAMLRISAPGSRCARCGHVLGHAMHCYG